ncbi:MAG TPA: ATP-dependent DNA helicase RecG [Candidatus Polarisedimenticolaceae bacterium]|nr:ATP-dependent DNA helicase RecG [Candidatus Polarisedimenticolaceae bacterium]
MAYYSDRAMSTIRADTELRFVRGVGPRRAEKLSRLGYETVEDLLYVLPFRWEDRRAFAAVRELRPEAGECTVSVKVERSRLIRTRRRGFTIFEATVADASGVIRAVWYNQPYLERLLTAGREVVLYGRASIDRSGRPTLDNPEYEFVEPGDSEGIHAGRVVPVYRKLADLSSRALRAAIHRALSDLAPAGLRELIPLEVARAHGLIERRRALREIHFPPDEVALDELAAGRTPGQRTLAFEEIYLLQLALALRRHGLEQQGRGIAYAVPDAFRTRLARMLPFKLTAAQRRVLREIGSDLTSDHPMNRLLQGDVGSGKTVVALLTLLVAIENGYQGALMAPTEILAEQHFRNLRSMLEPSEIDCRLELLTGSLRAPQRKRVLERIASGEAQLAVGTHALFEAGVGFRRLGLVVIDEQHRFGVLQRAALARKGRHPDVLVMTATPIPRSLALTLYGDLDLSVIDELPPGRKEIRTLVRAESDRRKVYDGLRREVQRGRQAYVVVPLVAESERVDLKAATEFADHLAAEVFADLRVGMMHGRLKPADKDRIMQEFREGRIQVLVSTTVIEVGVDVPNATVMLIEHAERFGLSQLHQLRGRVGRGAARSYCVLMVGREQAGEDARERLEVMERTNDGFQIAERDLHIRGPGVVFGTQQHGLSDLQFLAQVVKTPELLEAARREARALVAAGEPSREAARRMLVGLGGKWRRRLELAQVG